MPSINTTTGLKKITRLSDVAARGICDSNFIN